MQIDEIIRSRRKTLARIVRGDGRLVISAPLNLHDREIMRFVNKKEGWIRQKKEEAQQRSAQIIARRFVEGESFLFLGQAYPLHLTSRLHPALVLQKDGFYLSRAALPQAKDTFTRWYKEQARLIFSKRLQDYAARYGLSYKKIRISSARTRWGSYSTTGTISFTWRLVMAPLPVIDYIVVHELAHTLIRNHSDRFWSKVRAMMPEYKMYREWLKHNGSSLTID